MHISVDEVSYFCVAWQYVLCRASVVHIFIYKPLRTSHLPYGTLSLLYRQLLERVSFIAVLSTQLSTGCRFSVR